MMHKPKLLMVSDTYHPQVDGTVKFIDEFMVRSKDTFDISMLVPAFSVPKKESRITYLEVSKIIHPLPTYPSIKFSWKNMRKIARSISTSQIIFIQGPAIASLLSILIGRFYKKKVIFYIHVLPWELFEKSSPSTLSGIGGLLIQKICISLYNRCHRVIVPYQGLEQQLEYKGLKTKTVVARLGVDIDLFSPAKEKKEWKKKLGIDEHKTVLGYVGRISQEKNTLTLLEAFKRLPHRDKCILLIVGDGAREQRIPFEQTQNCIITGFVDNVQDYLKAMDIFVMPSLTETTSLATLEAMASGLPVVATRVGFMKNYITKGYNGIFFPRNSAALLATKLEKLIKNKEIRVTLGLNARKTIAYSFSWERSINRIKRILVHELD